MVILKPCLELDDFIQRMQHQPIDTLRLDQLCRWVAELRVTPPLLQRVAFCDRGYTRTVLWRTSEFEILLMGWQPGQGSTIHDHGNSLNVTRVCQGILTSRSFRRCSDKHSPAPALHHEDSLTANGLAAVNRYEIHQIANTSFENLVTLHVYARSLHHIQVYCPTSGSVEQVSLASTAA